MTSAYRIGIVVLEQIDYGKMLQPSPILVKTLPRSITIPISAMSREYFALPYWVIVLDESGNYNTLERCHS
jgi:hypothetical protein